MRRSKSWCGWTPGHMKKHADSSILMVNRYLSPLGPMVVVSNQEAIFLLEFADRRALETQCQRLVRRTGHSICPGENELMNRLADELDRYFEGKLSKFETPIQLCGTEFQTTVWKQLQKIPFGATTSYEIHCHFHRAPQCITSDRSSQRRQLFGDYDSLPPRDSIRRFDLGLWRRSEAQRVVAAT